MGLERSPFSLVRITEELLEWESSGEKSRKRRSTAVRIRCADHVTPSQNLAQISPISGGRSVGMVSLWTKDRIFMFVLED
jgi:hypothetical protein